MTDKEFRRLDKRDLYELLLEKARQNDELKSQVEKLTEKVNELEQIIESRRITIDISDKAAADLLERVTGEKNEDENSSSETQE